MAIEIRLEGAVTVVEVAFVAPVQAGHEVLVLELAREGAGWLDTAAADAVVDVTASAVYADDGYASVLKETGPTAMPPAQDPAGALGPTWRVKKTVRGRVQGVVVTTRHGGESNHALTLLWIAPLGSGPGYRG